MMRVLVSLSMLLGLIAHELVVTLPVMCWRHPLTVGLLLIIVVIVTVVIGSS